MENWQYEFLDSKISILENSYKDVKEIQELRKFIDQFGKPDIPRYYEGGRRGFYTITTPRNENGKYIVPKRIFIPKDCWGKEVTYRDIEWMVEDFVPLHIKYPF